MEFSVENTGSLGRKVKVQLPADEVEAKVDGRIREMGRNVRLKGFRPGRVPFNVLRQRYGQQVRREVVGELIQETFQKAVVENKLRPASSPRIATEGDDDSGGLAYTASFDVFPEIEKLDLSKMKVDKPASEVEEKDVDNMIQTLREQRRTWVAKEGAAKEGDLAFFRYSVDLGDGQRVPEDPEQEGRAGAILGHAAFDAGFEKKLEGLKAGDDKTFKLKFDENTRESELAGKSGKVTVHVEKVQESKLPEVDEEFAESFGVSEGGVDQLRTEVRRNLERELKQALSRRTREKVISALIEQFDDIEIPAGMVEQEMRQQRQQALERFEQAGGDPQQVPPEESFREVAERRVRGALIISEVARHADIEVDMGRVRDKVTDIASTYEEPQAVVQMYYQREDLMSAIQNLVVEEQAVEWVLEQAKVKEDRKSFAELMNPNEESGSEAGS